MTGNTCCPLIPVCVLLCGCSPVSSADGQQLFCSTGRELPLE